MSNSPYEKMNNFMGIPEGSIGPSFFFHSGLVKYPIRREFPQFMEVAACPTIVLFWHPNCPGIPGFLPTQSVE